MTTRFSEAVDLHQRILALSITHRAAHAEMCELLLQMEECQGYRAQNAISIQAYAQRELQLTPTQTKNMLRVARALRDLPALQAAFGSGDLAWSKVREIVRVASPETQQEWLDHAYERTCSEIQQMVARTRVGDRPPHPEDGLPPRVEQVKVTFKVEASDAQLIRKAIAAHREAMGEEADADCDDGVILADLARTLLLEKTREPEGPAAADCYQVNVTRCPSCDTMAHVGRDHHIEVSPELRAEIECCAPVVDLTPGATQGQLSNEVPPRIQRVVRARAGFRCEVPGCSHSLWTHIHHIKPKALGIDHSPGNLSYLCSAHHRRVHRGHLIVWRDERDRLAVERVPEVIWPQECYRDMLFDVLETHALRAGELCPVLGVGRAETLKVLRHLERRGVVVQATSGEWALAVDRASIPAVA